MTYEPEKHLTFVEAVQNRMNFLNDCIVGEFSQSEVRTADLHVELPNEDIERYEEGRGSRSTDFHRKSLTHQLSINITLTKPSPWSCLSKQEIKAYINSRGKLNYSFPSNAFLQKLQRLVLKLFVGWANTEPSSPVKLKYSMSSLIAWTYFTVQLLFPFVSLKSLRSNILRMVSLKKYHCLLN